MDLIPTRLQEQTTNPNAGKGCKQDTPKPSRSPELTLHSSDTYVTAFGAFHMGGVVGVTGIAG